MPRSRPLPPPAADARGRRRGRGRRPTEQVRAEILAAAGELVLSEGMGAFTIDRVATMSGASKMTIYKLWPSRGVLALEGYASTVDPVLAVPDSGDIVADLTTQLTTFAHLLSETPAGRVTAELFGTAQTDPELADALHRSYSEPRRAAGRARLLAARTSGQLREDVDIEALIDQLWGACLYRLMVTRRPLSDAYARALVANVITGAGPGG